MEAQEKIESLTIENIVDYAIKNKKKFDAYSPKFDRWNTELHDEHFPKSFVGVELKPNVWFWWEQMGELLFFSHRYNRVNGSTIKTFKKGWDAKEMILKSLNF